MAAKIFRINYKSDFILTLTSDAGWMTPFCIKFWTGSPMLAYYASWDGETYTHCAPVAGEPTKLLVQFDDHHLPIGDLKYQVAYHFTVADFPNDTEDEVMNQANITTEIDGQTYQVMLDFNGETAPEIQFSLPAYENEEQRIANEEQRIANEQTRIDNEALRISAEQTRQDNESQRIRNEQTRINQEEARVREFATLKNESEAATTAANNAATLANQKAQLAADKAQLAADKAALAQDAADLANQKAQLAADKAALADDAAALANQKAALAQQKAEYAKDQGDYAKQQGDYAKSQADLIPAGVMRTALDATFVNANNEALFYMRQADATLAGLMTSAEHKKLTALPAAADLETGIIYDVSALHPTSGVSGGSTYASLSAALAIIPQGKRKGGMSVKFVQSSDNKYISYMYKLEYVNTTAGNSAFVNTANWEKINLENELNQLDKEVDNLQYVQDELLVVTRKNTITKDNFTLDGVYSTTEMSISSNANYKSTPIYNVNPGDVFVWSDFPTPTAGAFALSLYSEDGTPVTPSGGSNNRIQASTVLASGYTIPLGVKKVGFVWNFGGTPLTAQSKITSGQDTISLTEDAKDLLDEELTEIREDVSNAQADATKANNDIALMLESIPEEKKVPEDFTTIGLYKGSVAEIDTSYSKYRAIPLINVVEGQVITWHKWQHGGNNMKSVAAIFCYDNDGLPFDGVNARLNYNQLTTYNLDTGEFTFEIPSNCSQIGLAYNFTTYPPEQEGAEIIISEESIALTDLAKELVNNAVERGDEVGDDSSKYYLKGNSNIQFDENKKLGIISAGQSNIDGRNSYNDYPYLANNPNQKVHFKNSSSAFSPFEVTDGGQNNDWSFDAIVYNLLTEASHGNLTDIYVMKKSMGGTSIDAMGATNYHWTADYEFLSSETYSLLRSFERVVRGGIASDGSNFEIKALLWHQGEGDMQNEQVANRYYENLKNVLAYVRGVVGNPRLHVFCGNISLNRTSPGFVSTINAAYTKLASEDPYLHVVDMSNAALEDGYHFNYQWSIYFGQKVYDLMIDAGIITGTKINPSEPS